MGTLLAFLAPHVSRIVLFGGLALAAAGAVTWWSVHQHNKGYAAAIADIAAQNKEATDAAQEARARVRACNDTPGMRWDQVARECVGAE